MTRLMSWSKPLSTPLTAWCVCVCVCVHEHGMLGLTFAAARELDPHCVGVS